MAQKQKKRTISYGIKITVFTDHMEEIITNLLDVTLLALKQFCKEKSSRSKIEFTKNVIKDKGLEVCFSCGHSLDENGMCTAPLSVAD